MNRLKEFAIVFRWEIKGNTGGPSGYLNNLSKGFEENGHKVNVFSLNKSPINNTPSTLKGKVRTILEKNKFLLAFFLLFFEFKSSLSYLFKLNWSDKAYFKNALEKNFLQFESVEDLYDFKKKFKYSGTTILTPHRPEPFFMEKINEVQDYYKTKYSFPVLKLILKYIEKKAYSYADAFIFPSPEAMVLYESFPGFKKQSKSKPIEYVFTGAPITLPTISEEDYRSSIGIKDGEKLIAFIGRHNEVKGYDLLTKAFSELEKLNVKVVCAGPTSDIKYPDSEKWIELGKISDPYNLINSADVLVLPNRNTYFDLIAIETLSQGKIIVASSTGGNISLSNHSSGVVLFKSEDIEDFVNKIKEVISLGKSERIKYEQENKNFFLSYCNPESFSTNYLEAVSKIMSIKTIEQVILCKSL